MAGNGAMFFAADRMLTRTNTQAEPRSAKVFHFPEPAVTVMWAGSAAVFGEVIQQALASAKRSPGQYRTIQSCVDLYCQTFAEFIGRRAERDILTRMGLTRASLVSNKVTNDRAMALVEQITTYALLGDETVEVIIAGHDETGGRIFSCVNEKQYCHDVEAFAAIGIGADHARAFLDFAAFGRGAEAEEAMVMAYLAKRRAEVAPGVGRITDLGWRISAGSYGDVPAEWTDKFAREYQLIVDAEKSALATAVQSAIEAVKALAGNPPETTDESAAAVAEREASDGATDPGPSASPTLGSDEA